MEKNVNSSKKIVFILLALIVVGLLGYLVYDKLIKKECSCGSDTQEKKCDCVKEATSDKDEAIKSIKELTLTTENQEITIGKKTYKVKKIDGNLYIDDEKVVVNGNGFTADHVYLTNKYMFVTIIGQFDENIVYAINEKGSMTINDKGFTMHNFKVVDGNLHATGGKVNEAEATVDAKDPVTASLNTSSTVK